MAAAGNMYRHDYEDVVAPDVWVTLQEHLPRLRVVIEQLHGLQSPCRLIENMAANLRRRTERATRRHSAR
jgi:hypothetical protein